MCTGSEIPVLSVEHGASFLTTFIGRRLRKVGQCMQNVGMYRPNANIHNARFILQLAGHLHCRRKKDGRGDDLR